MSRLFTILILLALATPCLGADQGLYIGVHGGTSDQDDISSDPIKLTFEPGYMAGVTMGYDYGFLRTELELSHRSNDVEKMSVFGTRLDSRGEVSMAALLLNVLVEYDNPTPLIPYAGLGVGWSLLDFDDVSVGGVTVDLTDDDGAAVQVMLGLGYELSDRWRLNLDYRAVGVSISNGDEDDSVDDDYFSSSVSLGMNCYF